MKKLLSYTIQNPFAEEPILILVYHYVQYKLLYTIYMYAKMFSV